MKLRLKGRVAIGNGFTLDGERRSQHARDGEAELRDRQQYQRCGGGRRVIRKKVGDK